MINVTKAYLPPLAEYTKYLEGIWERCHLTNNGPLVQELEQKLKDYIGVKHLFFVNNGTIALQIAIKALSLKGEIITTPFSYVATTSSIVWENCIPVFADIDPDTLMISPAAIEKAITPATSAILATHVYGGPCEVEAIEKIALKHKLKVIYDAAHAFGTIYKGNSILNYGDISTLSFHATKLFHTTEGGAIVTNDDNLAHTISYMRNFGHKGQEDFWGLGINGKNSEFHAAMGLCILPRIKEIMDKRKQASKMYDSLLDNETIHKPHIFGNTIYNFAYYPVLFPSENILLRVRDALNAKQVFPRRYFYPSLNSLNFVYQQNMPVSEDISKRVLCLPLYYELSENDIEMISSVVNENTLVEN
ncbi:DegT/DnrJ/EryC1/StrS family aminotransferase [Rhodocytophaga rosea]|uniref:DegT/DnrJ/EryC1/StrS family aminotransferase n=1 Tax=Rhodocytophaga rosea TaxID=2704465 RepID=A0A6C0GPN2_9BACT|nr:DegT/DnrJ/EryC1/StrS family aminotransferase [Rhodocytophaga rosea]QHT69580.1 DegT/DnrJ/EryC1/StrS family aminotransferase [Rhodocytophaga rosea]